MIIQFLCVVISFILLRWSFADIMLRDETKKYFQLSMVLTILVVLAEIGCQLFDNTIQENRIWSIVFNMTGFSLSPFVFLFESFFYTQKRNRWIFLPAVINFLFVCFSPIFGLVFFVTPDCVYHRGTFFFVYLLSFGFSVFVSLRSKLEAINHFPFYFKKRIISSSIVMLAAILVQVIFPQYHTTWIIICIYFVLYYALICEISSMVDGLTGLLNKAVFNRCVENLQLSDSDTYYLFMIDVNDFKVVNDRNGHLYGDQCLIEIASILKDIFGSQAQVFRFGGDEFSVFLKAESEEMVKQYLHQLDAQLMEKKKKSVCFPDIAIGYEKVQTEENINQIIEHADRNMYENKRKMKNLVDDNVEKEKGV